MEFVAKMMLMVLPSTALHSYHSPDHDVPPVIGSFEMPQIMPESGITELGDGASFELHMPKEWKGTVVINTPGNLVDSQVGCCCWFQTRVTSHKGWCISCRRQDLEFTHRALRLIPLLE